MNKKERVILTEERITDQTGEVLSSVQKIKVEGEPDFVKLYLDCLSTFKGFSKSLNPILLEFLRCMSYANTENGGQIIYVNAAMKKNIAKKLNKSIDRINQALTDFVKKGILARLDTGMYQVNPYLFGRGQWKDVRALRATFDFNTGEIKAEPEFDTDETEE